MNKLTKPTVGPLLGYREYSTDKALQRVLVRGRELDKKQTCYFLVREIGGLTELRFSKQLRGKNSDYTAIIDLDNLPLDTRFEYKVTIAQGAKKSPKFDALKGKDCFSGTFETRNKNDSITSFVFGSCCHFSLTGLNKADDAAFKTMIEQWSGPNKINDDFMMMLGDQIYGDHRTGKSFLGKLPVFRQIILALKIKNKKKINFKHYLSHYKKAFKKINKRKVMSAIPTYMIFDDHEVHNDWGSNKFLKGPEDYDMLSDAMKAYNIYQVSHPEIKPPRLTDIAFGKVLPEAKYYYQYCHGKSGFFVMDTRFNKVPLNESESNKEQIRMITGVQMNALKTFLSSPDHSVKFIATSVPMMPDAELNWLNQRFDNSPQDRWEGHTIQRLEILDYIKQHNIPNVIFLSGDVHVSYAFSLSHKNNKSFKVHQLTSSAFNWGLGLNDGHFSKGSPLKGTNNSYIPQNLAGNVINEDNFCRVAVKTNKVDVKFYHAKTGKVLRSVEIDLI